MLCSQNLCYGCFSCANTCPKHAINMKENELGAIVPIIDEDKCIECHLCESSCPVLNPPKGFESKKCYAGWSKDDSIKKYAASGGIASTIYDYAIKKGYTVFGTEYIDGNLAFSYYSLNYDPSLYSGSKYVHAFIGEAYKNIKSLLEKGNKVIFVGMPCQVAGLRTFLHREYKNLFLVDIVCHGVSPQRYLKEYVKSVCGTEYEKVLFRGEQGNRIAVYKENNLIYCEDKWFDAFSMAYAKGLISRENCYSCPFSSVFRQGDITLGDFWGLDKAKLTINAEAIPFVSLILVNTNKGTSLFTKICSDLEYEERSIEEARKGNTQLVEPCKKNCQRGLFIESYSKKGFMGALKSTEIFKSTKRKQHHEHFKRPLRLIKKRITGG